MTINGKEYSIPELDYNAICELDKYGVNLLGGESSSPFVMLRGFLALAMRCKVAAGKALEEHINANNGDMSSLTEAFEEIGKAIENSHFFIPDAQEGAGGRGAGGQAREGREEPAQNERERRGAVDSRSARDIILEDVLPALSS